jgi:hypothetical protein
MNDQNHASMTLDGALNDGERHQAQRRIEASQGYCVQLQTLLLDHCEQHGC